MTEILEKTAEQVTTDGIEIVKNMAKGDNPIVAVTKVIDTDKDGRISLAEIRFHRWTILLVLAGIGFGMLIGNPTIVANFVQTYYYALAGMFVSFWLGWIAYWMFKEKY